MSVELLFAPESPNVDAARIDLQSEHVAWRPGPECRSRKAIGQQEALSQHLARQSREEHLRFARNTEVSPVPHLAGRCAVL